MDNKLIENWNQRVQKDDEIYVIGDFIWPKYKSLGDVSKILNRLNGDIHLIPGDHDISKYVLSDAAPGKVVVHDKVHILTGLKDVEPIVLCHWSFRIWPQSHFNSIHLFGHSHNNNKETPLMEYGRSFNVGVDVWNYSPISLLTVLDKVKTLGDNPNFIKNRDRQS